MNWVLPAIAYVVSVLCFIWSVCLLIVFTVDAPGKRRDRFVLAGVAWFLMMVAVGIQVIV